MPDQWRCPHPRRCGDRRYANHPNTARSYRSTHGAPVGPAYDQRIRRLSDCHRSLYHPGSGRQRYPSRRFCGSGWRGAWAASGFGWTCCPFYRRATPRRQAPHRWLANARVSVSLKRHRCFAKVCLMSTCVFIQIRCKPGSTYKVADQIALREIHSELYSTSGDYDLLMKVYIPSGEDVGKYINDQLLDIDGIERSLTTMTFKVF
mmetsp:Transcript_24127/g.44836  ORF Transcript_24127/g.44836 Transcript_24127/m.44836 type:complete len:205 (+) Transcript_24127:3402-4016(+)